MFRQILLKLISNWMKIHSAGFEVLRAGRSTCRSCEEAYTENGGTRFIRNAGAYLPNYTMSHLRKQYSWGLLYFLHWRFQLRNFIAYSSVIIFCVLVFKTPTIKTTFFWVVTSWLWKNGRRFRGTYCLQLNGQGVSQTINKPHLRHAPADFSPALHFDLKMDAVYFSETSGSLRNATQYTVLFLINILYTILYMLSTDFCYNNVLTQSWLSLF
jgi:hypothetical protein